MPKSIRKQLTFLLVFYFLEKKSLLRMIDSGIFDNFENKMINLGCERFTFRTISLKNTIFEQGRIKTIQKQHIM